MSEPVTRELAAGLVELAGQPLPEGIRDTARRSLLNVLGTAIGASRQAPVEILVAHGQAHGAKATTFVPGRSERLDPLSAALVFGFAAHLDDFDDTHLATVIHPGAATLAATLSAASLRTVDGATALRAFALGCEAQLRVGVAMSPEHYEDGWHITGTCAPIGAAVAAGLVLGLPAAAMARAVGLAASQALGVREGFGTMMKPFHPGKGAVNGLTAAMLVDRGFTAPTDALEHPRGFFAVLSPRGHRPAEVTEALGGRWELADNTFKPYPCGIVTHPAIDAAVALAPKIASPDAVAEVVAQVHPLVPDLTGNMDPHDGLEARFSTAHGIAAGLADGRVGLAQYADGRVTADDVRTLRRKVRYVVDPSKPRESVTLTVHLTDGNQVTEHVAAARGSLARPLTDEELVAKVRDLVEPVLAGRTGAIVDAVASLEDAGDLAALAAACAPGGDAT